MSRWMSWLPSGSPERLAPPAAPADLAALRAQMLSVLDDCLDAPADRMRTRLLRARTANELWLARCDVYQLIASRHCESTAAQRINGLIASFEGWLPQHLLRRI